MILKLNYFGMIAEAIGKNEEKFDFSGKTIEELNIELRNNYSKLNDLNYKFAINQSMVLNDAILKDNDEVALLPPFAGG